jgi:hypothetical protein
MALLFCFVFESHNTLNVPTLKQVKYSNTGANGFGALNKVATKIKSRKAATSPPKPFGRFL